MKKILSLIFLSVFCLNVINAKITWKLESNTLIISGTGDMENYDNEISVPWYSQQRKIKNVIIKNGVTSIGSYAFQGCIDLTSTTISNSVISIGSSAFADCISLTSIAIPNSVTSIGFCAFQYCSELDSITIPNSVTNIGYYAFNGCSGLTSITISNNVKTIGSFTFADCINLTSITIPNSVTSIGSHAFYNCKGLTSVTIPNSVTDIGWNAFSFCKGLTSITIPNSVTYIGDGAFYNCTGLTSITIPNSVTKIGYGAFYHCKTLEKVTIEVNRNLQLKSNIFEKFGFKELFMKGETLPNQTNEFFLDDFHKIYVPTGLYDKYCSTRPWNKFKEIIFADEESRDNIINNKKQESKNSSKIQYINGRKINKKIFHPDHYIENEKVEVK